MLLTVVKNCGVLTRGESESDLVMTWHKLLLFNLHCGFCHNSQKWIIHARTDFGAGF